MTSHCAMDIVVGNRYRDPGTNNGRACSHFSQCNYPLETCESKYYFSSNG